MPFFTTNSGGYIDTDYMDHARRMSDMSEPAADPLGPAPGVLTQRKTEGCQCGGECGHEKDMTVNHGFTAEPLVPRKGLLK